MKELIVYPTPYLVKQHRAAQLKGKQGVTGEYPVTYEIFIEKCIKDNIASKTFLGDFKKNLIIERIFWKLKKQNKLKYFDTPRPGYIHRIGEVIGELKQQNIDAKTFEKIIDEKACHQDISIIYQTYQDFLEKNHFYDKEDRYILCRRHILKSEFIAHYDTIHFKEFHKFSIIQEKILEALGSKIKITDSDLTVNMRQVKAVKAQNRRTEIINLAHVILQDLQDGLLPENICIVLRNRDAYENLLRDIFDEMCIPISLDKQAVLLQNPFIKALLRLLRYGELTDYFSEEWAKDSSVSKPISEWIADLENFLEVQGYPEKFCHIHDNNLAVVKRDIDAFQSLQGVLTELNETDKMISEEAVSFTDFATVLDTHLQSSVYSYSTLKNGIWILPPAMLRGLKFDKIYVPGMVEGEFPRDFRPDWLLKDKDRAEFNRKGYKFDTLDLLLERERESFGFLISSSPAGYFSYPMILEDNTSSLMSLYLEELCQKSAATIENVRFESVYCGKKLENIAAQERGVITGNTKQRLKEHFCKIPFSTTALNMYGECPYKFFLARVLNLSPVEEEDEYTAIARGTVIHKILEIFFKRHREKLDAGMLDEYANDIKALADEVIKNYNLQDSFAHPLLLEIEKCDIVTNIVNYLVWHIKQMGDFVPAFIELGFGYKNDFSLHFAPDIQLVGKIDRIDEDSKGRLVIFDYKVGSTPDINKIEDGTNLQLPIYIMVSEQLLKKPVAGGAFVSIKKGAVDNILVRDEDLPFISKRRKKGILSQQEWDNMMEAVRATIRAYVDDIREAKFLLNPKKCPKIDVYGSFCDFTGICPWEGED